MSRLRILADDLTGACDTAGAWCAAVGPVPVLLGPPADAHAGDVVAYDLNTRVLEVSKAQAVTAAATQALLEADPATDLYIKVDSTLRGHVRTTVEQVAAIAADVAGQHRIVVCPALPSRGRTVVGGRLHVAGRDAPVSLSDMFAGIDVEIPDVATEADLAGVAASATEPSQRVVWVGSSGLARHLAGDPTMPRGEAHAPQAHERVAVVVGSNQTMTLLQVEALSDVGPPMEMVLGDPRKAALVGAAVALCRRADALVVTGGYTARRVLEALGVRALLVGGEVEQGVPWATVTAAGDEWTPSLVITKAGGFGDELTLQRAVRFALGADRARMVP